MKFGPVPLDQALGAILAHSELLPKGRLRKGVMLESKDIAALREAGRQEVVVAQLDPDDLHEDHAAEHLAKAITGQGPIRLSAAFTGRVNLIAEAPGVVCFDPNRLNGVNGVDPMITVATLPPYQQVQAGQLIATIKIIAYGVAGAALDQAAASAQGAICLVPPVLHSASLIITTLRNPSDTSDEKGERAIAERLTALNMTLTETLYVPHQAAPLASALAQAKGDLVLLLTASATSDPFDTGPEAVRQAGGVVERFGMPVDPGNLLFLGHLDARPVIGLPGCARSPALNGADWVLSRVACGIPVTGVDIAAMGVGGLLKEIPTRPQPRRRPDFS